MNKSLKHINKKIIRSNHKSAYAKNLHEIRKKTLKQSKSEFNKVKHIKIPPQIKTKKYGKLLKRKVGFIGTGYNDSILTRCIHNKIMADNPYSKGLGPLLGDMPYKKEIVNSEEVLRNKLQINLASVRQIEQGDLFASGPPSLADIGKSSNIYGAELRALLAALMSKGHKASMIINRIIRDKGDGNVIVDLADTRLSLKRSLLFSDIYESNSAEWVKMLEKALRIHHLLKRKSDDDGYDNVENIIFAFSHKMNIRNINDCRKESIDQELRQGKIVSLTCHTKNLPYAIINRIKNKNGIAGYTLYNPCLSPLFAEQKSLSFIPEDNTENYFIGKFLSASLLY